MYAPPGGWLTSYGEAAAAKGLGAGGASLGHGENSCPGGSLSSRAEHTRRARSCDNGTPVLACRSQGRAPEHLPSTHARPQGFCQHSSQASSAYGPSALRPHTSSSTPAETVPAALTALFVCNQPTRADHKAKHMWLQVCRCMHTRARCAANKRDAWCGSMRTRDSEERVDARQSHQRSAPSALPAASTAGRPPSSWPAAQHSSALPVGSVSTATPDPTSHRFIVWSRDAEKRWCWPAHARPVTACRLPPTSLLCCYSHIWHGST